MEGGFQFSLIAIDRQMLVLGAALPITYDTAETNRVPTAIQYSPTQIFQFHFTIFQWIWLMTRPFFFSAIQLLLLKLLQKVNECLDSVANGYIPIIERLRGSLWQIRHIELEFPAPHGHDT